MREFKGRIVAPGTVTAPAVVSHGGLNTLASFQGALQFGDKKATCGDQNNPDLYNKPMCGKALCLPQTIGSTTGGLVPALWTVSPPVCCFLSPSTLWQLPVPSWPLFGWTASICRLSTPWVMTSWSL